MYSTVASSGATVRLNEAFDSGFSMGLMRKDVRLAMELASRLDVPLEIGERVGTLWRDHSRADDDEDFNRIADLGDSD